MTDTPMNTPSPADSSSAASPETAPSPEKDVDDWATGGEPATGPQLSYLETLAREAGEQVPDNLTKADASKLIDRLQGLSSRTTGTGQQSFDAEPGSQGDDVADQTAQEAAPGAPGQTQPS